MKKSSSSADEPALQPQSSRESVGDRGSLLPSSGDFAILGDMSKQEGTPQAAGAKRKTARGRRKSHAARLTTESTVQLRRKKPAAATSSRSSLVRENVIHAALECFGAFGFEGTSTRAVAERAGVSHPLLLYHFESKDLLWQSTMDDVIDHYREEMESRFAKVDANDSVALLQAFIENFVRYTARVPQLHRIMTQESTQGSERIRYVMELQRSSFNAICKVIRQGQTRGLVRSGEPARIYYAIIGLAGTLLCVSTEYELMTGRQVFSEPELKKSIQMISDIVFIKKSK